MKTFAHTLRAAIALVAVVTAIPAMSKDPQAVTVPPAARTYPPYPETWSRLPPAAPKAWLTRVQLWRMPNGDVLQSIVDFDVAKESVKVLGLSSFFEGKQYASLGAVFGGQQPPHHDKSRVKLRPDRYAESISSGTSSCSRGLNDVLRIVNEAGGVIYARTLLVVLPEPKHSRPLTCEEMPSPAIAYRVAPLRANLLALEDGSFLAIDSESGITLRLTEDLQTRSPLLGKMVFIVEPDFLNRSYKGFENDWSGYQASLLKWAAAQGSR